MKELSLKERWDILKKWLSHKDTDDSDRMDVLSVIADYKLMRRMSEEQFNKELIKMSDDVIWKYKIFEDAVKPKKTRRRK